MRYDDRLATVLGQPAADARGRAVQWRQLVELLSHGEEVSADLVDRALTRIAQLMKDLPIDLLSATSRAIAGRTVPAELVAMFATRGATPSAALLAAADLTPAGWSAVRAVAADDVLPLLAALGHAAPESASDAAVEAPQPPAPPPTPKPTPEPVPAPVTIPAAEPSIDPPRLLSGGLLRWETGPTGEIDWVDGVSRAAVIGRSVAESFADRFAARLPFTDEPLVLAEEGALSGEWRWSGAPTFFPDTGRFAGYRGVARREGSLSEPPSETPTAFLPAEDDGLREVMHELRTPLNAIIGFGEIIEGQYLGPAHRAYRDRASQIVRQARSLSDAVDNLDLAARLRSGRLDGERKSGIEAIRELLATIGNEAAEREVRLLTDDRTSDGQVALPPSLARRLVEQFALAMTGSATPGERLAIVLDRLDTNLAIGIDRPRALHGLSEQQILADRDHTGIRFALRLVQGLAAMTGGRLDIGTDRLLLLLPLAD